MEPRRDRARLIMLRTLMATVVLASGLLVSATPVEASPASVDRLAGADRYATAAAISRAIIPVGVPVVFVATGSDFPDSLAAGPAAGRRRAPILLTARNGLPEPTRTELFRLKPASIVVLGGTGVVSNAVQAALDAYTVGTVTRIAGANRFATAAMISARHFAAGVPVAYVATGRSFPDALSAGAAAAKLGGPVLLVDTADVPSVVGSELSRLRPGRIVVVGGRSVVSDGVLKALDGYTTGTVTRQAGADRFATAAAISAAAFPRARTAYVASGFGFADAVAGVPGAALAGAPLLLSARTSLPSATRNELRRLDPSLVRLLGGQASLSDSIIPAIREATAFSRVGPHLFRVDGYTVQNVPADMLAYNGSGLLALYGTRSDTGAFIYQHTDGKWYDHPVGQAQYIVNMLRNYRLKADPVYLDLAIANGNRLLQRAVRHGGGIFFPYAFDFVLHGRGTMEAPWYSGMAQGVALSGFVRLYEVTKDPKWLQAAHDTFASFKVPRQAGKPWFAVVENGLLWFEEYPWTPYDHTYNGHTFATYGVYDYWRITGSLEAAQLTIGGITTTARVSGTVRTPGGISHYCISQSCLDRRVRTPGYHLTHVFQFIQLHRYTKHETFGRLADTFIADNPDYRIPGTVIFKAGDHVGYVFDASGTASRASSLSLASPSNSSYSQRNVPYGWIKPGNGIWFYVSAGYFEAQWIRESSAAYARGFVDVLNFYWPRPVAIGAGMRTGYQFDGNGAITATSSASTAATTWSFTSRARINGRPAVLLVSGPLSGYWLPVGTSTAAGDLAAADTELRSADASKGQVSTLDAPPPPPAPVPPEDPLIPPPLPGQLEAPETEVPTKTSSDPSP